MKNSIDDLIETAGQVVVGALLVLTVLILLSWFGGTAEGSEPPVAWSDDPPAAWTPPVPSLKKQWVRPDGVYEEGADGVWRKTGVSGVTPAPTFQRAGVRDSHACPTCNRSQFVVDGWNRDGTHRHRCPADGTVWSH